MFRCSLFARRWKTWALPTLAVMACQETCSFNASKARTDGLEQRISNKLSAVELVRSQAEMQAIVEANPFLGQEGAAVTFLAEEPDPTSVAALQEIVFEASPPVIDGRTVYHIFPTRPRGKRTSVDLERILAVAATGRSARVVAEILRRMSE